MKNLKEVLEAHREEITKIPGVVGVGGGLSPARPGECCILVCIETANRPSQLPFTLDGYPVEVIKTDKGFRPL